MDKELLIESGFVADFSKINCTESVSKVLESKGDLIITLPVCKLDVATANGRTYTSSMMEKALEKAKPAIQGRMLTCSADDHPASTHVAPIHASHLVLEAWVKDGMLWNKWKVLETDNGRNLKALINGGVAVGTSIRGRGRISPGAKTVEDYDYLGTDCVGNPAAGTYALAGAQGITIEVVESVKESNASDINIPGVGPIHQNSTIKFRGSLYRVSNIAGSSDQYQMTLYNKDETNPHAVFVMSSDIKDPKSEIELVQEGSEEFKSMDKLNKVMETVREASDKLQKIRESNDLAAEMKHVAAFEYGLSINNSLSGTELKKVQEAWDKEKTKKITKVEENKVEKVPVELQLESLNTKFGELQKMVEAVLVLDKEDVVKFTEEEQKMISVMKSNYNLDDAAISEVLQAYLAFPDEEKGFVEELQSRLGEKAAGIDLPTLYKDVTAASGDRQYAGDKGITPTMTAEMEDENNALSALVSEFCDRLEGGDLVKKEDVAEQVALVIKESRSVIRRHQLREALVTEMLVESIMSTGPAMKKFKLYSEQFSKLWNASLVIINQLKEEIRLKEGRVVTESLDKDKKVEKIKAPSRVPGWK